MLLNYIKIAYKVMLRHKLFTFINLFGISFTLLILILGTSFVDHTFGQMKPETRLNHTLSVTYFKMTHSETTVNFNGPLISYYFLNKYVKTLEIPEKISISSFHKTIETYHNGRKNRFAMKFTDEVFWEILDFKFLAGRPYLAENIENIDPVAVITQDVQKKYFGNAQAINEYIELDGKNYKVIGVVENVSILRIMPYADVWVPISNIKEDIHKPSILAEGIPSYYAMLLAKNKADIPLIKSEFQEKLKHVEFLDGKFNQIFGGAESYGETISRVLFSFGKKASPSKLYILLFILMILFMILPTVNMVNINVSRMLERSSEIGIRKSFGASSRTLVGQFLVENIFITLLGGLISIVFAEIILIFINNADLIKHVSLSVNWRIFYTSILVALFFGLFSGVYPAYKMSRMNPAEALKGIKK